jgi:hypothetical protein
MPKAATSFRSPNSAAQIRLRGFKQQVEMVAHQHPYINPPTVAFANLPQTI